METAGENTMIPNYDLIPDYTMAALKRYTEQHIPTGDFLRAVLSNDLKEAFGRADDNNCTALFHIAAWLYNEAPSACWGSPEKVESWLSAKPQEA